MVTLVGRFSQNLGEWKNWGWMGWMGMVTPVKDGKPGNWLVMSVNQSSGGG